MNEVWFITKDLFSLTNHSQCECLLRLKPESPVNQSSSTNPSRSGQWWESFLIQRRQHHNIVDRQSQDLRPSFSLNSALALQSVSTALLESMEQATKEGSTDRADLWLSFHRQNNSQDTSTEETTNQSLHKLTFATLANIQCWFITVLWHNRFVLTAYCKLKLQIR